MHLGSMKFKQRGREEQAEAEGAVVRRLLSKIQQQNSAANFCIVHKISKYELASNSQQTQDTAPKKKKLQNAPSSGMSEDPSKQEKKKNETQKLNFRFTY